MSTSPFPKLNPGTNLNTHYNPIAASLVDVKNLIIVNPIGKIAPQI